MPHVAAVEENTGSDQDGPLRLYAAESISSMQITSSGKISRCSIDITTFLGSSFDTFNHPSPRIRVVSASTSRQYCTDDVLGYQY